jgi:hypothetical protein
MVTGRESGMKLRKGTVKSSVIISGKEKRTVLKLPKGTDHSLVMVGRRESGIKLPKGTVKSSLLISGREERTVLKLPKELTTLLLWSVEEKTV